jgi:hypothetical protein
MPNSTKSGEEHAWELLSDLDPEDVCRRADVSFDCATGCFKLRLFSADILVCTSYRSISGDSPATNILLERLGGYARLSALWYLVGARDIPVSGKLVKPGDMGGGEIYERGTHVLPLDRIAEKYGSDVPGFLARGRELGGKQAEYRDVSLRLLVFPRVPVVVLLWKKDPEFAARAGLLFDSSARFHLPVDVIWSTAMVSLLAML